MAICTIFPSALELVSSRHAEELVQVLRKEAARATSADHDDAAKYRQLLVRALHKAALKVCTNYLILTIVLPRDFTLPLELINSILYNCDLKIKTIRKHYFYVTYKKILSITLIKAQLYSSV